MVNQELKNIHKDLMIEKTTWENVSFGHVAIQKKKNVDRETTQLTKYIKGEHMNSEDLHIREWGDLKDEYLGPAFYRSFEKGHILYASRRTYLRKVAIADFAGITSNTTFVINPNEKAIIPDLLPFIMLSEGFAQHSIKNSKGSVNPYVNWKDIASYEFFLPPKDQQAKIAELLWAIDDVIEKNEKLNGKIGKSLDSFIENEIHGCELNNKTINQVLNEINNKIGLKPINELGVLLKGKGIQKKDLAESGIPCVRYGELYTKHHRIIKEYHSFIPEDKIDGKFLLKNNDVLFAGSGETIEEIGKSAAFISDDEVYASSDIIVFRSNNMNGTFLGYLMNSLIVRKQLNKYGTGASVMHIYRDDINKIMVPNLDKQKQDEIALKLEKHRKTIELNSGKIQQSKQLQKSLINEIFSS